MADPKLRSCAALHLRFGWWSLLAFLTLGLILEALHGFKIGAYVDVDEETRRLMWTLAHAHGTLLSLVHLAFASSVERLVTWSHSPRRLASRLLLTAGLTMPLGFFLAGFGAEGGDPGYGIVLVAVGGLSLLLAVLLIARQVSGELGPRASTSK